MFQGWQRADVISALAVAISCLAAFFTWQQMRIARRKERAEIAASDPTIEVTVTAADWPGWYKIALRIRNQSNVKILCTRLSLVSPRGAFIATIEDAIAEAGGAPGGGYVKAERKAPVSRRRRQIDLDLHIPPSGHKSEAAAVMAASGLLFVGSSDVGHLDILAFNASATASRKRVVFWMSLRTERTNASGPYRDIKVVASVTPVSTSMTT